MTEITFNRSAKETEVKVLLATKEEALNYGVTGGIIDRSTFNRLKDLVAKADEGREKKEDILVLNNGKDVVKSKIVDSTPTSQAPPSKIISTLSPKLS